MTGRLQKIHSLKTVETYVRTGKKLRVPEGLPEEMYSRRAGVFVSLKEEGRLRGCIGTIAPVRGSIAEEIIENGISAAAKDPRFHGGTGGAGQAGIQRGCAGRDGKD